jgi:hypothetical protein
MCEDPWRTGCEVRDMVRLMLAVDVSLRWKMGVAIVSRCSKWMFRSVSVSVSGAGGPKEGREGLIAKEADERLRDRRRPRQSGGG